jgi:hypothetical protein
VLACLRTVKYLIILDYLCNPFVELLSSVYEYHGSMALFRQTCVIPTLASPNPNCLNPNITVGRNSVYRRNSACRNNAGIPNTTPYTSGYERLAGICDLGFRFFMVRSGVSWCVRCGIRIHHPLSVWLRHGKYVPALPLYLYLSCINTE